MVAILKYKNIDVKNISVTTPEKINGNYTSKILYQEQQFLIQTPELEIISDKKARFKMVNKGQFFTLLEDLEETLVENLTKNSVAFFKGKTFSEKRIRNSLRKLSEMGEDGYIYINNFSIEETASYIDFFKEKIDPPVFPYSADCMLSISDLIFGKLIFRINATIKNVKVSLKKDKKRFDECFLGENSEIEEDPVYSSDILLEDPVYSSDVLIEDLEELNLDNFEEDSVNMDELDFFEENED